MIETTDNVYANHTAIRTRMVELGLAASLAEIDQMHELHSPAAIQRALDAAHDNPRARAFVERLLYKVRKALGRTGEAPFMIAKLPDESSLFPEVPSTLPALRAVPKTAPLFTNFPRFGGDERSSMITCFNRQPNDPVPVVVDTSTFAGSAPAGNCLHVYGKQSALTIQSGRSSKAADVVFIEAASKTDTGYDWANKLTLMLSRSEMLHVLTVILNYLPSTTGRHHGSKRDKWFEVERQANQVCMKVGQSKTVRVIAIGPDDCFGFASLLLTQIRKSIPADAHGDVVTLLRQIIPMVSATAA
ncbi:MAG: hypothetical protein ABI304_11555 [Rudaea sp.]